MAFVCLLHALTTRGRLERGFSLKLRRGARPRSRCELLSCARLAIIPERGGAALVHVPLSLAASARVRRRIGGACVPSFVRRSDGSAGVRDGM